MSTIIVSDEKPVVAITGRDHNVHVREFASWCLEIRKIRDVMEGDDESEGDEFNDDERNGNFKEGNVEEVSSEPDYMVNGKKGWTFMNLKKTQQQSQENDECDGITKEQNGSMYCSLSFFTLIKYTLSLPNLANLAYHAHRPSILSSSDSERALIPSLMKMSIECLRCLPALAIASSSPSLVFDHRTLTELSEDMAICNFPEHPSPRRLWFKTNLKLCKIWFDMGEYGRMNKILKELHKSCQRADGTDDQKKRTQLLEKVDSSDENSEEESSEEDEEP
ncbi:hypothetical protein L2E82_30420 [Cichorium intybus]|uniref:Uncharacterized protein n=1 Tax=Cichorium intybus TaxID=13427 RepID=A0ACB9D090_CICIN|nr:hypothetical protein L2E82_30420 [Cichorium intybus]